jgi:hypothetical protein
MSQLHSEALSMSDSAERIRQHVAALEGVPHNPQFRADLTDLLAERDALREKLEEAERGELKNALAVGQACIELQECRKECAEILEALRIVVEEKAPAYHDCIDNGESECGWCIARAAIAKHKENSNG